jgi:hypothetical protein
VGRFARPALTAVLITIGASCGDGGPPDDIRDLPEMPVPPAVEMPAMCDGPSIRLEDLFTCATYARCARVMRCEYAFDTVKECLAHHWLGDLTAGEENLLAAVDRGTTSYDGEAAAACIDWVAGGACSRSMTSLACELTFAGTLADGDSCYLDRECGTGGYCVGCAPDECCKGTCSIPGEAGEPCPDERWGCAPGLLCDAGTCIEAPATCFADADCAEGLHCAETGLCVDGVGEGGRCTLDPDEDDEDEEDGGDDGEEDPGSWRDAADQSECAPGLYCVDSRCQKTNFVGAPCERYEHCTGGLYCDYGTSGEPGSCQPRAAIGEACRSDLPCLASAICDVETSTCVALSGPGEFCVFDTDCAGTLHCWLEKNRCSAPKSVGTHCLSSAECAIDLVCGPLSTCVSGECPAEGEAGPEEPPVDGARSTDDEIDPRGQPRGFLTDRRPSNGRPPQQPHRAARYR